MLLRVFLLLGILPAIYIGTALVGNPIELLLYVLFIGALIEVLEAIDKHQRNKRDKR